MTFLSRSEDETMRFGRDLARGMTFPAHVLLFGDLGAGKTTFTKGLALGFGVEDVDAVASPTFTLLNEYPGRVPVYHIDLYRVDSGDDEGLNLEEIFDDPEAAVVVEWAERLGERTTPGAVRVQLTYVDPGCRRIEIDHSR